MNLFILLISTVLGSRRSVSPVYTDSFRSALHYLATNKSELTESDLKELHTLYIEGTVGENRNEAQEKFVFRVYALCPGWHYTHSRFPRYEVQFPRKIPTV